MPSLDTLLSGLAKERATGALRIGRTGTVYLDDGRITYMTCTRVPGAERLLAAAGRVPESALRRMQSDGGTDRLLEEGRVTLGELQYCVLGAVLDAAFFLLPATGTRPKFRPGEGHWLGGRWYFDVPGLVRECARRRARLAETWPRADADTAPVRLAPRLAGQSVTLTDVQWEVAVRADGEATPLELAKRMGRSGYAVLLAVRRLAAAGLIVTEEAAPLPQRVKRLDLSRPRTAAPAGGGPLGPAVNGDPTDIELLLRLRKALEELS
ncbi:MAG TPA: hypothetical protein VKZ82_09325 [Nonomuraea sp.]|nr:hypothetical protein [Nonomuraea sp.]